MKMQQLAQLFNSIATTEGKTQLTTPLVDSWIAHSQDWKWNLPIEIEKKKNLIVFLLQEVKQINR